MLQLSNVISTSDLFSDAIEILNSFGSKGVVEIVARHSKRAGSVKTRKFPKFQGRLAQLVERQIPDLNVGRSNRSVVILHSFLFVSRCLWVQGPREKHTNKVFE